MSRGIAQALIPPGSESLGGRSIGDRPNGATHLERTSALTIEWFHVQQVW